MNLIILRGRTTKEPDIRFTQDGRCIASFRLAVNRSFTNANGEREADFFSCTAFGKTAETIQKYVLKGTAMLITGELQNNNWTDKDGVQHYDNRIIVNRFEFAESKNANAGNAEGSKATQKTAEAAMAEAVMNGTPDKDGFINVPDAFEDFLPFN